MYNISTTNQLHCTQQQTIDNDCELCKSYIIAYLQFSTGNYSIVGKRGQRPASEDLVTLPYLIGGMTTSISNRPNIRLQSSLSNDSEQLM